MAKEKTYGSTKDLKRVLGKKDLVSIAVGATIGSGIFSLTGICIGMTGRSVSLAFILSAILVTIVALPVVFVSGTVRIRGGQYTQAALLLDQRFAGFLILTTFISNIGLAKMGISFAQYMVGIVPGLEPYSKWVAFAMLTAFYLINLSGIENVAKVQNLMVLLMAAALALFVALGIGKIQPGYFQQPGWMTGGTLGLLTGTAYLQSATAGSFNAANYSGEAKNPTKDVPFAIIVGTMIVAVIYMLVGTVAAGVLPVEVVANQPLTLVAAEIMPRPLYVFFIIGGAGFALATTLNALLGWLPKPMMQACADGWFPASWGAVTKKTKVPYVWLTLVYLISSFGIVTGWDIATITSLTMFVTNINNIILSLAVIRLPKVLPEQWSKSYFRVSDAVLWMACVLSALAACTQLVLLFRTLTLQLMIGSLCFVAVAIAYVFWRNKYVHMEVSYEDS